jgi:hypothetical protein
MTSLAEICREAAGVVPAHPSEIRVRVDGVVRALRPERNPSADELLEIEQHLQLGAEVGGVRDSDLNASGFTRTLRERAWRFLQPSASTVTVTLMPMASPGSAIASRVEADSFADFLNEVSHATMNAGIDDMQLLLGEASGGSADDITSLSGMIIDIDDKVADPAEHHIVHRGRLPALVFATESGGARLLYFFEGDLPLTPETERLRAQLFDQLLLTFPGVDPAGRSVSQRQYLPMVWRTTKGVRRAVVRRAIQLSVARVTLSDVRPDAPYALLDALDLVGTGVSDDERSVVEAYLESIGIAAPQAGSGSVLYSRCPLKEHSSRKAYVNKRPDGRISVYCLGGHDGEGHRHWSERDLLQLARGGA